MSPGGEPMSGRDKNRFREQAINALMSETTIERAARKAQISKSTLLRWMKDPEFRRAYAEAKADCLRMASAILTRNSAKAAVVLAEIFKCKRGKFNQSSRVSAAIGTIRLSHEAFSLEVLEERISKLEAQGLHREAL